MTEAEIRTAIDARWDLPPKERIKMDWLGMESVLRDAFQVDCPAETKIAMLAEILAAWTGRGDPLSR